MLRIWKISVGHGAIRRRVKLAWIRSAAPALKYWEPINAICKLDPSPITWGNASSDPTFHFMTVDHEGKIPNGWLSPYARAGTRRVEVIKICLAFAMIELRPSRHRHDLRGLMNH